jgi:uncharacterized damage-inducible protein DinB
MIHPTSGAARRALLTASTFAAFLVLPGGAEAQSSPALDGARNLHEMVRDYLMTTANESSESLLAYRPTDEVRSLGEMLGHVGNASFAFCSTALGESSPATGDLEAVATKAELVSGLRAAFDYCDRAYREPTAAQLAEEVNLFGMTGSRIWVLMFNATHNWEHYGNIVTYLRLNGIVPPSSRGGM